MILIDTSIWIDHFRVRIDHLLHLAQQDELCIHPFVIGELASGRLGNRKQTLADLHEIPRVLVAQENEVLLLIETYKLMGRGLGYVDLHLIASAKLNQVKIWTRDKRMKLAAHDLKIAHRLTEESGLS
jgi:hypothetical protein